MGLWGTGHANGSEKALSWPLYYWGVSLDMLTVKLEVTLHNDPHKNLVWTPAARNSGSPN